ncbi:MAG: bifunctional DNA-formamidopyrimidine glycosylase/DNA-(apurinic or apyrimidinic site) lyase [Deltaproteobacteria bacterium]|nr:bifunctional DNA-formamidopyrimidine glycosylase/DNA-(apurinic or apyrimidinic site) lyase [Deltaproteobacteria bacterium]
MPELPEVECVRRTLTPRILGRTIAGARVRLAKMARPGPEALAAGLGGKTVRATSRRGKLLLVELDQEDFLAIHLGMTGQLILAASRPAVPHIHLEITFTDGGDTLFFRDVRQFGFMAYCPDQAALAAGPMANLGPDALGLEPGVLAERLAGKGGRLKNLLLDQRILAGVGNIYADECLHRAGLSPLARPRDHAPEDLCRLGACLQETLHEALAQGGSSVRNFVDAEGRPGTFQEAHRVYQRGGQPCPMCGESIHRIVLAGRSTHYCPRCQPGGEE